MSDFENCLKRGLIKKRDGVAIRSIKSIDIGEKFLSSATKNFEIEEYEMCVIAAYNSIFHCCRALLFNKDYIEKSHFCLVVALEFLYREDKKLLDFLNAIDKIRISRHNVQYSGELSTEDEASFVLDLAEEFLNYTKKKLK